MKQAFESIHHTKLLQTSGSVPKGSRWCARIEKFTAVHSELGELLYFVLRIAIARGWYKSVLDTPLFTSSRFEVEPAAEDEDPSEPVEVAPVELAAPASGGGGVSV